MVSIIIPTFEDTSKLYDELFLCMKSIRQHTNPGIPYEIIVVDCGNEPRGYVQPSNQGMAAGRYPIKIVFNKDSVVGPGWLEPLIEACLKGYWLFSSWHPGDGLGAALGFSPEAYAYFKGFDPAYRYWYAPTDLERKCQMLGKPMLNCRASDVRHIDHGEQGTNSTFDLIGKTVSHPLLAGWVAADEATYTLRYGPLRPEQRIPHEDAPPKWFQPPNLQSEC